MGAFIGLNCFPQLPIVRHKELMDCVGIDDNYRPEADFLPLEISNGERAEEEAVLAGLGLPVLIGHAAVPVHRLEEFQGAAAEPLAEGEVGAIVIGAKVCGDQDALKPADEEGDNFYVGIGRSLIHIRFVSVEIHLHHTRTLG